MSKPYQYKYLASKKHRLLALFLCVFFGYLGLHYFYVGRHWRGALNLFLLLALTIASSVFGLYYIRLDIGAPSGIFVHWREAVAVICAAILGITWIVDIVHIAKGQFKDAEGLNLK